MDHFWDGFIKQAVGVGGDPGGDRIDAIDEDSYFQGDMRTPTQKHYRISGSVDLDPSTDQGEIAQDRKQYGKAINAPKQEYNNASSE